MVKFVTGEENIVNNSYVVDMINECKGTLHCLRPDKSLRRDTSTTAITSSLPPSPNLQQPTASDLSICDPIIHHGSI